MSLGEDILAAASQVRHREDATHLVPEWVAALDGRRLFLREMSGHDRDAWQRSEKNGNPSPAALLVRCLVDEDDRPLFAPAQAELLNRAGAAPLMRLYSRAVEVNFGTAKEEDSLKNGRGNGSSTDSLPTSA